jgi:phytol kinase
MTSATLSIATILIAMLVTMRLLGSRRAEALLAPEIRRKLLHLSMGGVSLCLPLIFDSPAQVWCLAGLTFGVLAIIRATRQLKTGIGGALHSIERNSVGELCFPLGVATLFSLAGGSYLLYLVPMLILTLGDSLAALAGIYYGRCRFLTADGYKTIEGSATLFVVSLACVLLPFGFAGTVTPGPLLLIALNLALLITLVEAICWRGMDNFAIPVAACYLLDVFLPLDAGSLLSLALSNSVLLVTSIALLYRRQTLRG